MWNLDFGLSFKQQAVEIVGYLSLSFLWSPQQRKIVSSGRRLLLVACASELLNKDWKEPFFILSSSSIAVKRALDDKANLCTELRQLSWFALQLTENIRTVSFAFHLKSTKQWPRSLYILCCFHILVISFSSCSFFHRILKIFPPYCFDHLGFHGNWNFYM